MKKNYQLELDQLISALTERPRLLLHACCAPCATYVTEYLRTYFDITLFYYNPNTHPQAEYEKRLSALKTLAEHFSLPLIEGAYDTEHFFANTAGMKALPEGGARCTECFHIRLSETARTAKALDFDYYCSTLSVSPHKNAALLNEIGNQYAAQYGIPFLPNDFKKRGGFLRSTVLSKELGLYRQDYCGCIFSIQKGDKNA